MSFAWLWLLMLPFLPMYSPAPAVNLATGLTLVQNGEGFSWKVVNTSQSDAATYRVRILRCSGGNCVTVLDSGAQILLPGGAVGHTQSVPVGSVEELYGIANLVLGSPIVVSVRVAAPCSTVPCTVRVEIQPGDFVPIP